MHNHTQQHDTFFSFVSRVLSCLYVCDCAFLFSIEDGPKDFGHALGYAQQLMYIGAPLARNLQQTQNARTGRLYVKAYCLPNHYIIHRTTAHVGPTIRECFPCPSGFTSVGGSTAGTSSHHGCDRCPAIPQHAEFVPDGHGCGHVCLHGFFGADCVTCSALQAQANVTLPPHAKWVDGEATCRWACIDHFFLQDGVCRPPPVPTQVKAAFAASPGPSSVTVTFGYVATMSAPLVAVRFGLAVVSSSVSHSVVAAQAATRTLLADDVRVASPTEIDAFSSGTGLSVGNRTIWTAVVPQLVSSTVYAACAVVWVGMCVSAHVGQSVFLADGRSP